MTQAERILIRWLAALSAGVTGVGGVIVAADSIDKTIVIAVLATGAFLSGLVTVLTTEAGSSMLGVRRG